MNQTASEHTGQTALDKHPFTANPQTAPRVWYELTKRYLFVTVTATPASSVTVTATPASSKGNDEANGTSPLQKRQEGARQRAEAVQMNSLSSNPA